LTGIKGIDSLRNKWRD